MRRLLAILLVALAIASWGLVNSRADPLVRRATIGLADWPAGAPPVRAVLISDIHIGNLSMSAARLGRIVDQVNALRPDIVFIAGDFAAGNDPVAARRPVAAMARPLARLKARLGVVAVLGNHDHETRPADIRAVLRSVGITVLDNRAVAVGPLAIGGIDDLYTGHARRAKVVADLASVPGARVFLAHGPDFAPKLPVPSLLLAGHTHCGQVVLPVVGYLAQVSYYGARFACGLIHDGGQVVVVTAGLGTSDVPIRFGAPPDLWLLTLGRSGAQPR